MEKNPLHCGSVTGKFQFISNRLEAQIALKYFCTTPFSIKTNLVISINLRKSSSGRTAKFTPILDSIAISTKQRYYLRTHSGKGRPSICSNAFYLCNPLKGKFHPVTHNEGTEEEQNYSSTLSLASTLDGVGVQRHAPVTLPPEMTQDHCRGGWGSCRAGLEKYVKSRPPTDYDPWIVQPVESSYTKYSLRSPKSRILTYITTEQHGLAFSTTVR